MVAYITHTAKNNHSQSFLPRANISPGVLCRFLLRHLTRVSVTNPATSSAVSTESYLIRNYKPSSLFLSCFHVVFYGENSSAEDKYAEY